MSEIKLAILVMGYNRIKPLKMVLESLKKVTCKDSTPLIISIDAGGTPEINSYINEYLWPFGEKRVIIHKDRLGLRNHFIFGGDLTEEYDNILFLEDDIMPAPQALNVTRQLVKKYEYDDNVACGSLYSPLLCEFNNTKFFQIQDGYDVFFLAHPYWGTIWMKKGWQSFKKWYETYEYNPLLLPNAVAEWKNNTSFKKVYIQYLAETGKNCVYPRYSLVTNMGFAGVNAPLTTDSYQTLIETGDFIYRLPEYYESNSRYDVFMEVEAEILKKANPKLSSYDFEVDLKQMKSNYKKEYVLTTRKVKKYEICFSDRMKPMENGVVLDIQGEGIYLAKKEDVILENNKAINSAKDIEKNYPLEPLTSLIFASYGIKKYFVRKLATLKKK